MIVMKRIVRLAMAQIDPTVGDLEANRDKVIRFVGKAGQQGADIVVFPELVVTGYPPEDLLLKKHFVDDNLEAVKRIVRSTSDITAVIGFVQKEEGVIYNAAAVAHNGGLKGVYKKIRLPNYGVLDEKRYFTQGPGNLVFRQGSLTFGVTICEDIWDGSGPHAGQARAGARILINISASPYHAGKRNERERLIAGRARRTGAFICYVNMVGGQDGLIFDGGSFIVDRRGRMFASCSEFSEDLVIADIPMEGAAGRRKSSAAGKIKAVTVSRGEIAVLKKPRPATVREKLRPLEEIYSALVLGVRDYVRKNRFETVIVGLSGGIDSSIVALIACDAVGKGNVIGMSMPSGYTSKGTKADAKALAENLGIKFMMVPIDSVLRAYLKALSGVFTGASPDVTEENIQARIRGNILMALSNKFGSLVLTTGNKSETAVGYCTLYGDTAGGFAVIEDVPKTDVYRLARFRNNKEDGPFIPERIFTRPPSAELRPGQKDADSLPPYDVLDPILKDYVERDMNIDKIRYSKISRRVVRDVVRMVDRNEYKRRQAPPGVKITPKAFGRDRRLPITNRYRER